MEHADILFLCANPTNANPLQLDREVRELQLAIESTSNGGPSLKVATRWATQPLDLLREMRALHPTVLHFSGYGARDADGGIYLQDSISNEARLISAEAFRATLAAAGSSIRLIVLSACYTVPLAAKLLEIVDCVIGVHGIINEEGARGFTRDFYRALATGHSVASATLIGNDCPELQRATERGRPTLQTRGGIDALQVFVAPR